jgi:hypothetical protein
MAGVRDAWARQERRKGVGRQEQQTGDPHEGRKSTAWLPGWGDTLSSMNWSAAQQKIREVRRRKRSSL